MMVPFWSGGGGSRGGYPPPPAVYSHSTTLEATNTEVSAVKALKRPMEWVLMICNPNGGGCKVLDSIGL